MDGTGDGADEETDVIAPLEGGMAGQGTKNRPGRGRYGYSES